MPKCVLSTSVSPKSNSTSEAHHSRGHRTLRRTPAHAASGMRAFSGLWSGGFRYGSVGPAGRPGSAGIPMRRGDAPDGLHLHNKHAPAVGLGAWKLNRNDPAVARSARRSTAARATAYLWVSGSPQDSGHPLDPLRARRPRLERIAEILGLAGHLPIEELHDAHGVRRPPVIG